MAEVVDSIIGEMILRIDNYERNALKVIEYHKEIIKTGQGVSAGQQQYADQHARAAKVVLQSEEQTNAQVTRSRKKRVADAKASDEAEVASAKKAAKEREAAAKAAARGEEQARKQAEKAERDYQTAVARLRDKEIKETRQQRAMIAKLRSQEAQSANQVNANSFLTGYRPANGQRGEGGTSGVSARASAEVFREQFRLEDQAAREAVKSQAKITREKQKAADEAALAAKRAADAEIAEAERSVRIREAVERGYERSRGASGGRGAGGTVPREGNSAIPPQQFRSGAAAAGVAAEATAQREVNHLAADRFDLEQKIGAATGKTRAELERELDWIRRINAYKRAGLSDDEAALRAERETAAIERLRGSRGRGGARAGAGGYGQANELALGLTGGRFGYSFSRGAIAGLAVTAGIGIGGAAISAATAYAKSLEETSKQLGIASDQLQAYQKLAIDAGVSQEQLTSSFSHFANTLGRAQEGDKSASRLFSRLGVSIKEFASAGDALPVIIDRISKIAEPAKRAAVETALFGESGRKLDSLLSGGSEQVNNLAKSLQATGKALSQQEIKELGDTARKLEQVKAQLQVDIARIVAGNADAIENLATAFSKCADAVLRFLGSNPKRAIDLLSIGGGAGAGGLAAGGPGAMAGALAVLTARLYDRAANDPYGVRDASKDELLKRLRSVHAEIRGGRNDNEIFDIANAINGEIFQRVQAGKATQTQPSPTAGIPGTGGLFAPDGKSADTLAREAAAREKRYQDEAARLEDDRLQGLRDQTADEEARREYDRQALRRAEQRQEADYELQVQGKQLTRQRADQLKAAARVALATRLNALDLEGELSATRRSTEIRNQILDAQQTILAGQAALAPTAKERARIEKQILDKQIEAQRNSANDVLTRFAQGDPSISQQDVEQANQTIADLPGIRKSQQDQIDFQNRGPLREYLDSLPRTADKVDEALQRAAVGGFQAVEDRLTSIVAKFLHLNGLAGEFASQIIKIGIQREIIGPIADALFPEGGGIGHLFGFATGGAFTIGGNGGIDRNILSINGRPAARVSHGETVAVIPNIGSANGRVSSPQHSVTVIAPQQFDLRGVVMTESLVRQFDQRNRAYADAVAARAGQSAVQASPGYAQKVQTLGN